MKFRNKGEYFVPELVNMETGSVDRYFIKEEDVFLPFILQQISSCIDELLQQYPMCSDEEEIDRLLNCQAKFAKYLGISSDCCYQYFGKKDKVSQGIVIGEPIQEGKFPMKITTTDFMNGSPVYQRRVDVIYDQEEECFIPKSVVEVEKNNGMVVQSSISPRVLKKVKKYIRY